MTPPSSEDKREDLSPIPSPRMASVVPNGEAPPLLHTPETPDPDGIENICLDESPTRAMQMPESVGTEPHPDVPSPSSPSKKAKKFSFAEKAKKLSQWRKVAKIQKTAAMAAALKNDAAKAFGNRGEDADVYEKKLPPLIIPLESPFRTYWDLSQLMVLSYVALVVPVRVCFSLDTYGWEFCIEVLVDLYFYCDIVINFLSAHKIEKGIDVIFLEDYKSIALHYLRGWFLLDTLACLPLDYILRAQQGIFLCSFSSCDDSDIAGSGNNGAALKLFKVLRTFRLMKLVRLTRFKRILSRYEDRLVYWQHVLTILKVFSVVFVSAHWLGCFYGAVYDWTPEPTILEPDPIEPSPLKKWVTCFYWAIQTTTTVGYGDLTSTSMEGMLVSAIAMTVGGVIFSWFMSNIFTMLNPDPKQQQHQEQLHYVISYLRGNKLPVETAARVLAYFRKSKSFQFDESKMFEALPIGLRQELFDFLYRDSIRASPVFSEQEDRFVAEICLFVAPVAFEENDLVFQTGDIAEEMYILVAGKASVISDINKKHILQGVLINETETESKTLTTYDATGAYFGEECLFGLTRRLHFVVARSPAKMLSVHVQKMQPLLDLYPLARTEMQRRCISRIKTLGSSADQKKVVEAMGMGSELLGADGQIKKNFQQLLKERPLRTPLSAPPVSKTPPPMSAAWASVPSPLASASMSRPANAGPHHVNPELQEMQIDRLMSVAQTLMDELAELKASIRPSEGLLLPTNSFPGSNGQSRDPLSS